MAELANLAAGANRMDAHYAVYCGDSFEVIPNLGEQSVDLVVTSPPYFSQRAYAEAGLGNEASIAEYLDHIIGTFRRLIPVMKPTGSIVYNMGDKITGGSLNLIPYRFAIRVLDELNVRLVNDITWVKKNPTPHQFHRRLISSTEPFFHFALGNGYYYDRPAFQPSEAAPHRNPTEKLGGRYRELIESSSLSPDEQHAAQAALNQAIEEVKAGALHSFRMKIRGIHAPAYGGQDGGRKMHIDRDGFTIIRIYGNPMKRDVIESPVESLPGNGHPAIFPVKVIREIVRLLCPPGGQVLDPYLGSGSTMVAAILEGRRCLGIDISQEYCDAAWERAAKLIHQPEML